MTKKHIIFDIDGTLINSKNTLLNSLQDYIFELKREKPEEDD